MSRKGELSCLEKRELLNQPAASVETLLSLAAQYEEAGLVNDAVDFYEKANATEPLERLLKAAEEEGDLFLFNRLCRTLGHKASGDQWARVAEEAERRGKLAFAVEARRMIDQQS